MGDNLLLTDLMGLIRTLLTIAIIRFVIIRLSFLTLAN